MRLMHWLSELQVSGRNVNGSSCPSPKDLMESSVLACFACRQRPQRQVHKPSHNFSSERCRWTEKGQLQVTQRGIAWMQREALDLIDWRHDIAESGWDFLLESVTA